MEIDVCRLCLDKTKGLIYIFEVSGVQSNVVAETISDVLQLPIRKNDKYQPYVCRPCYDKAKEFKRFKDQCIASIEAYNNIVIKKGHTLRKRPAYVVVKHKPIQLKEELGIFNTSSDPQNKVCNPGEIGKQIKDESLSKENSEVPMESSVEENIFPVKLTAIDQGKTNDRELLKNIAVSKDAWVAIDRELPLNPNANELTEELIIQDKVSNLDEIGKQIKDESSSKGNSGLPMETSAEGNDSNLDKEGEPMEYDSSSEEEGIPLNESSVKGNVNNVAEKGKSVEDKSSEEKTVEQKEASEEVCGKVLRPRARKDYKSEESSSGECNWEDSSDDDYHMAEIDSGDSSSEGTTSKHSSLSIEKKSHKDENSYERKGNLCHICGKSFELYPSLWTHLKNVHSTKKQFQCEICGKSFKGIDYLKLHSRMHSNERPYKCKDCSASFRQSHHLLQHRRVHTKRKMYPCNFCNADFNKKGELEKHYPVHDGDKRWECEECREWFDRWKDLVEHRKLHPWKERFKCDICGSGWAYKALLKKHIFTHTKPFECNICGKNVTRKDSLRQHMMTHSGEKLYHCSYCNKGFINKFGMVLHMRVHTGEKPFTCMLCSMSFRSKYQLKSHSLIHTGEKPHECDICHRFFSLKESMKRHKRLVH